MNDATRSALMNLVIVVVALIAAFGINLTQEQSAGIVALAAAVTNIAALVWKTGQQAG